VATAFSMKVQVNLKIKAKVMQNTSLDLTLAVADTVSNVKERVVSSQMIPFPEQDLMLDGEVLRDGQKVSDCGVKEGSSLDLVVKASEEILVTQLSELLQARDLSCDELGLLYCYKNGVSITQALKMIGHDAKFQDFLKTQKAFLLENGRVTLVREDTPLKPFSVTSEVVQILQASSSGTMEVKELCAKFMRKFHVTIASIAGMRPTEFLAKEKDLFVISGRGLVSLKSAVDDRQRLGKPSPPLGNEQRSVPPSCGAASQLEAGACWSSRSPVFSTPEQAVEPTAAAEAATSTAAESQPYLDLHNKICSRAFKSKITQALGDLVDAVGEAVFLDVDHVVRGGSVGKGTAVSNVTDAEVVLFLRGLPSCGHDRWLPPLLRAAAGTLAEQLGSAEDGVEVVRVTEDSVQLRGRGLVAVNLRFSPTFETYAETIQALAAQGPEARRYYAASLARERTEFVARQPGQVKVTIRLMKWWRDQQEWSSKLARPSDEILELAAIYSAVQTNPQSQCAAIANVLSLLSRFESLRVVWSNYYSKDDVWAPLLRQRPLLMDPTNPFVNVADPQAFDARELMVAARATHFFW